MLKEVMINFMSCESITIPLDFIGVVKLNGVGAQSFSNDASGSLHYSINELIISVDCSLGKNYLHRLGHSHDITSIQKLLNDNSGSNCFYYPIWNETDDERQDNIYQRSKYNKYGDLFLVISEDRRLLDRTFPDELVNKDNYDCCLDSFIQFAGNLQKKENWFVAKCLENNVASQGKTMDEATDNLREALSLYCED